MHLKKLHIPLLLWENSVNVGYMPVASGAAQSPVVIVQTSHSIILLIFCVLLQPITEDGQVCSCNCGFIHCFVQFFRFCFMFEALWLGACMLSIVFWWNDRCVTTQCTSLCLVILCVLKFTLSTLNITSFCFFLFWKCVHGRSCFILLLWSYYLGYSI